MTRKAPPRRLLAAFAVLVLLLGATQASAGNALPAGLTQALYQAAASANAMAAQPRIGDSGLRSGANVISHAVVLAIARNPAYASAIVREAAVLSPRYGPAIVAAARSAFPAFDSEIGDAGRGLAPAPATVPAPAPKVVAEVPAPAPSPPAEPATPTVAVEPPAPMPASPSGLLGDLGITELWIGDMFHDVGVFGRSKEDDVSSVDFGVRFAVLRGEFWNLIAAPRPHFGFHVNTNGDTSQMFGGFTWAFDMGYRFFVGTDFGLALHDGNLRSSNLDEKELGLRVLFRLGAELGYRFGGGHSLSVVLDHISNGRLSTANEGLDSFGLRYSYRL